MNTIYTTNIIFYNFENGAGALFSSTSPEADDVHDRPGRLRREDNHSAGGNVIIHDDFATLSVVVNKYLTDSTALTA